MPPQQSTQIPLAERMRPTRVEDFVGQEELLGEGRILNKLIRQKKIPSSCYGGLLVVAKQPWQRFWLRIWRLTLYFFLLFCLESKKYG